MLKKSGADAGADAEADATAAVDAAPASEAVAGAANAAPTVEAPKGANENDVARFPDETRLENVAASVLSSGTVREAPVTGNVVTTLAKGAAVTKISQRGQYFLVVFQDPKDASRQLMGWIHQNAFSAVAVADAGVKTITCAAGETALYSDGPFCGKLCANDAECGSGQACKGSANKLVNGKAGDAVTVCTVQVVHDAGAPSVARDAGLGGLGRLIVNRDAGAAPAPATPTGDVVDPTGGKCPANYLLLTKDNKCHKLCPSFDCKKETQFCIACQGQKVCSANRDLCK